MPQLPQRFSIGPWLALTSRIVLFVIFAASATTKLSAPGLFEADVTAYHLLPADLVPFVAFALPWIEALIAVYLLVGLFLRSTALLAGVLLLTFTAAMLANYTTGNVTHSCGCLRGAGVLESLPVLTWLFGGSTITPFDIGRDLLLAGFAAALYRGDHAILSLDAILFGQDSSETETTSVQRSEEQLTSIGHGSTT